ncbi:MAG: hypothetical protein ACPGJI_02970 [Kangiellaceae bacterium]
MQLNQKITFITSVISLIFIFATTNLYSQTNENVAEEPSSKVFDMMDDGDELGEEQSAESIEDVEPTIALDENLSTSEKLEALKQEVIAVNRDLFILEEDLLFPASTQVALYFSVDIGYFFALDNLKLKIDGKQVTHHLYTEKDVNALYRGAIQKAYLGNIDTGEHELVAVIIGTGPHNRAYRKAVSFNFNKETGAKAIEIQLRDDSGKLQPTLNVVEW